MESIRIKLITVLIFSAVWLTGCGGGGSVTPSSNDQNNSDPVETSDNQYSGSSNISGKISLSSLTPSDTSDLGSGEISPRMMTRSARASTDAKDNAIINLYAVGSNGELEDTHIDCTFDEEKDENGDPSYACNNVADGKNYVVKYFRILKEDKALEMKANVKVPRGISEAKSDDISPRSTVIVDAIVNSILTATEGKDVDDDIVDDIIVSVKSIVTQMIDDGTIKVTSMVVNAPRDENNNYISDAKYLKGDNEVKFDVNRNVEATTGAILSSEKVANEVNVVKTEIEFHDFEESSQDSSDQRGYIEKVFDKLLGRNQVPRFIVDFFTQKYADAETVELSALYGSIIVGTTLDEEIGVTLEALGLSPVDAASEFQATLEDIYKLLDKRASGTLTDAEKKQLAEVPAIIPGIFSATDWRGKTIGLDTILDVPEGIVFTIYMTDQYIVDAIEEKTGKKLENLLSVDEDSDGSVEVEYDDAVDFDPMHFDETGENPGLMQLFGFYDVNNLNNLDGIEIGNLYINPDKLWVEDASDPEGSKEYDMLIANVCVTNLARFAGDASDFDLTAELTYPTLGGGTKTVEMLDEDDTYRDESDGSDRYEDEHKRIDHCFTINPWATVDWSNSVEGEFLKPELDDVISDFTSGTYIVEVKDEGGNVLAKQESRHKVIVGMRKLMPVLTSPRSRPSFPEECRSTQDCPVWEELMTKWRNSGGNTTFALNVDTDDDGVHDKAKISITWTISDTQLPEDVKLAYSLNIMKQACAGDTLCRWDNVFSTWDRNSRIYGTSFDVPDLLEKLEAQDGSYMVNVCAEFVDTDSGDYLGRGGCGHAKFHVGQPLDLNAQFEVRGKAPIGLGEEWKVAIIRDEHISYEIDDEETKESKRYTVIVSEISEDGEYLLKPTIGDFLNVPVSHFSMILFEDNNGDDQLQTNADGFEVHYWPNWKDRIWFDTWEHELRVVREIRTTDGMLGYERKVMVIAGNGEVIEGPGFSSLEDHWYGEDDDNTDESGSESDTVESDNSER